MRTRRSKQLANQALLSKPEHLLKRQIPNPKKEKPPKSKEKRGKKPKVQQKPKFRISKNKKAPQTRNNRSKSSKMITEEEKSIEDGNQSDFEPSKASILDESDSDFNDNDFLVESPKSEPKKPIEPESEQEEPPKRKRLKKVTKSAKPEKGRSKPRKKPARPGKSSAMKRVNEAQVKEIVRKIHTYMCNQRTKKVTPKSLLKFLKDNNVGYRYTQTKRITVNEDFCKVSQN